ncbi:hypothetical protein [Polluticaenibacter yanchengensis]|uniref:CopG family transcriptional regulator n=1 Tax=Polluticaenibacter yanchengensis TaxID=3014562 RepID=A0ABT4UNW6_9BACT|nr:hypothetical protein [Chitinophagaceae bacterium LY-5]
MNIQVEIENKRQELIQKIAGINSIDLLDKIETFLSQKQNSVSTEECQSIEKGIADADSGKLNAHSEAQKLYAKWI